MLKIPKVGPTLAVGTGFLLANRANKAYSQLTAPLAKSQTVKKEKNKTKNTPGVILPPSNKKKNFPIGVNLNTGEFGPS